MSSDSRAIQAKSDGNSAWSEGKYDVAIEHFTRAISFGGNDKDFLKVIYSNRSAAHLKLGKIDEALSDGAKCVELDSAWVKGYSRKGDALLAARKFTEAYNAYNSGARLAPGDSVMTEKCEQAMRGMRNAAESASASSSTSTSTVPSGGLINNARLAILVLALLYLFPFSRFISSTSYRLSAGLSAALSCYLLFKKYGFPKFTSEYGAQVVPDPLTMNIFLCMFLVMSRPYLMALIPLFLGELVNFTPQLFEYVRNNMGAIQGKMEPLLARFAPSLRGQNLSAMFTPSNINVFNYQMARMAATCEVSQGIFLLVELALPTRNIIQLYLWWQYLQMRYMLDKSGHIKFAFSSIDQKISQLLSHRLCPAIVRTGYGYVKQFCAKQVEIPTAGSQPAGGLGSMFSKCTIM